MGRAALFLGVVLCLGLYGGDALQAHCDENLVPGTKTKEACDFLAGGGYTMIKILPALLVGASMVAARGRHRVGIIYTGFAVACIVLVYFAVANPGDYPWVSGRER